MIEMENVKKSFGNSQILKGISIQVNKGDVTVIIGPSGSGKTTLLRCINFLEKADEGKLTIDDLTVNMKKKQQKKEALNIRRKCAFVFQNYGLFLNKTALENVMEGLVTVQKKTKEEAKKRSLWKHLNGLACLTAWIIILSTYLADSSSEWGLPEQ